MRHSELLGVYLIEEGNCADHHLPSDYFLEVSYMLEHHLDNGGLPPFPPKLRVSSHISRVEDGFELMKTIEKCQTRVTSHLRNKKNPIEGTLVWMVNQTSIFCTFSDSISDGSSHRRRTRLFRQCSGLA